jgi:protein-disulfide isomerase
MRPPACRITLACALLFLTVAGAVARAQTGIPLAPAALASGPSAIIAANPGGDVTVVEFFDYQCPICRRVHPALLELQTRDPKVRVIHKHWPVLGEASVYAARVAVAARWQNKYSRVHDALMRIPGRLDEEKIRAAAGDAGVDLVELDWDLQERAAEIDASLAEAGNQALALGLRGTPGFVFGDTLIHGGISLERMRQLVREQRTKGRRR